MLDHVNWYLVELEQRLRGRRSAQATTDMLLETRAHLDERVAELTAKGLDPSSAAKAALADFGDPDSVVRAYAGALGVRRTGYGVATILASLSGAIAVGLLGWVLVTHDDGASLYPYALFATFVAGLIAAGLALRTRRWTTLPVVGVAMVTALVVSLYLSAQSAHVIFGSEQRVYFEPVRQAELDARHRWLAAYDTDFARVQEWRANRNSPKGDRIIEDHWGSASRWYYGYAAPVPSPGFWADRNRALPRLAGERLPRLLPFANQPKGYRLEWFGTPAAAKEVWLHAADGYAAFLKAERESVSGELAALNNPAPTSFGWRWTQMGAPLVAVTGVGCLFLLLVNGLVVAWLDLAGRRRRLAWRRQLG